MTWLIPASGVLLLAALVVLVRTARRRRLYEADVEPAPSDAAPITQTRSRPFMSTGSYRMEAPRGSVSDLRLDTQALLDEAEAAADLSTMNAYLADVRDALGADEAIFWRWSEHRDTLVPESWSTPGSGLPIHFDMGAWGGFVQWAAEGRVIHFDVDARIAVARLAAAPIEHDGRLIGVLSVTRKEGLDRGREHVKSWLPRHAAQVGRLVSLFELRRDTARYMRQSRALLAAAQRVQGHKSPEALCKSICEIALQVSSASSAALIRWRADVNRGWVQYTTPGFREGAPFELSPDSAAAQAFERGTLHVIEDASKTVIRSLFTATDGGMVSGTAAFVPLKLEERVIGGIVVTASDKEALAPDEARNVALLGALAATSLEMVWEMEEVSRRARTDALTGLPNRRAFDDQLEHMLAQADRFGRSVSLIVADVDHFKIVNDTWGHEVGDVVLRSIAGTLQDGVRAVDVCARFGGEEFAILLPETALVGAAELADRLRKAVEEKPIVAQGNEISITVSCGVATYPEGVLTKEALFAEADRALYEAKSTGRNRVKAAAPRVTGVAR